MLDGCARVDCKGTSLKEAYVELKAIFTAVFVVGLWRLLTVALTCQPCSSATPEPNPAHRPTVNASA